MACYKPLTAWYSKNVNPTGKRSLVFSTQGAEDAGKPLEIPCGQCIGCRLDRSKQWALRCIHEASLYEDNCFITLTFSPEELEKRDNPMSLDVKEFQRFMKRLRKKYGNGIRFFHCGEYGDLNKRPHYHACIFNLDFKDKRPWKMVNGYMYYVSDELSELWPYGFSTIGEVTFESAAYVARYILKKVNGEQALDHYNKVNYETGEIVESIKPEYTTMSRRPGIGKGWFDKFEKDVFPKDFVTNAGKKFKPPKYYDKIMESTRPEEFEKIKEIRKEKGKKFQESEEAEPYRRRAKEKIQQLKARKLVRNHDKEI